MVQILHRLDMVNSKAFVAKLLLVIKMRKLESEDQAKYCHRPLMFNNKADLKEASFFFKSDGHHMSSNWDHWYPCFGLTGVSTL